jgi:hypothetical protein
MVFGFVARAAAQGDAEPAESLRDRIRLTYQAPTECPDADTFRELVLRRVPVGWEASPEELARQVEVVVSNGKSGYVATIELVDERGERVARVVRGEHCPEVVDAMGLVTALTIQARVEEARDHSEPAVPPAAEATPSVPVPATTAPVDPAPPRPPPPPTSRPAAEGTSHLRISARGALTSGIGLVAAPGAALGLVFERRSARFGVALQGFSTGRVEARGVPVRFELLAARLEGCPYALPFASWASVEPCAVIETGTLTGEAYEDPPAVVRGVRGSALWLATAAAGRAVGRFGSFVLELEALVGVPIRRERFYVEGGDVVHRVPALYAAGAAGLGVRF